MKLVVGLGNPGPKYKGTRHNVGFDVIDELAARSDLSLTAEKFHGFFGEIRIGDERVILLKPTTLMNRSGQAAMAVGRFYKLELDDLMVIFDDHALPLGQFRMRMKGSAGSHNGMGDVINRLGSEEICRIRIGIGEPMGSATSFVLGRFLPEERAVIEPACRLAADAVQHWVVRGPELTMTRYNARPADPNRKGSQRSQAGPTSGDDAP